MSDELHEQGGPASGSWQGAGPAAGWYPDPWDDHRRRYWDGSAWTGDVSFEPPGNWGHRPDATQVQPVAPHWPASEHAVPAWGGGGWGQPPQGPSGHWGTPGWQQPQPQRSQSLGSRIHVGVVAVIAAIAVLAGIGIGSQVNASSSTAAGSTGGSGGLTNPFGGGNGGGALGGGSLGGGSGSGASSGSSTLTPAQQAVATKVDKSIVDINTELGYQNGAAAGTGMILTPNGTILTNNHVIDGATSISVTVVSTGKTYKADVVGDDVTQDVAVIQMQGASGLTPIALGNSNSVSRGEQVIALGNAGGAGGTPSAVSGTVTDLNQTITASDQNGANSEVLNGLIQTDAPIKAGDSGGPLVDNKGQVIGMDTAASSGNGVQGAGSVGFAIPISSATTIATSIQQGKTSDKIHIGQTGFLGVSVQAGGTGLPGSIGSGNGAAVSSVIPGSPADKAGITSGDSITAVDSTTVSSATDLTNTLRNHHPGDQVSLTWTDTTGASHTATVTLAVGPAA